MMGSANVTTGGYQTLWGEVKNVTLGKIILLDTTLENMDSAHLQKELQAFVDDRIGLINQNLATGLYMPQLWEQHMFDMVEIYQHDGYIEFGMSVQPPQEMPEEEMIQ
jgi:hypothetical protein